AAGAGPDRGRRPRGVSISCRKHPPVPGSADPGARDRRRGLRQREIPQPVSWHRRHPLRLAHLMRTVRHLRRMASIARTLARYDALFPLTRIGAPSYALAPLRMSVRPRRDIKDLRPGVRLARALHALGPSFIKLGQAFSVRPDLVGEELADDLATLQDHLPPFP